MNQPLTNQPLVDKLARALLYEGYILYPYRPSVKNTQRWTFGCIYPPAWSQAQDGTDPCLMQTQCLLESTPTTTLHIKVRFLHLLDRTIGQLLTPLNALPATGTPPFQEVPSLDVAGLQYQPWQEAVERTIDLGEITLATLLAAPHPQLFSFPAQQTIEPLQAPGTPIVALLIRRQQAANGTIECSAVELKPNLIRLTIKILNHTALPSAAAAHRNDVLLRSFVSTHTILEINNGKFLSQTDPPDAHQTAAAQCINLHTWPVLVGTPPDATTLLSSPITIEDYPKIAPESPGDLFDAGEIDEILTLRIMTLTDEEKSRAASVDDRVRDMLARTESLARDQLAKLHGAMRPVPPEPNFETIYNDATNPLKSVEAHGTTIKPGDPVRLHPLGRADIMDIALDGKTATIASIEQDFENRIHLAVTIDDDPGKDLGLKGQPGHRFFFGIEEIEPLKPAEAVL